MSHFAILCPPTSGHINPMASIGRTLIRRGHRVTMFGLPDLQARIEREGLSFWPIGEGQAISGELAAAIKELGKLTGMKAMRFTLDSARKLAVLMLDTAPQAMKSAGVDIALIDQNEPAGASAAEFIGLPFVSVAAALPLNREPDVPPPFVPWTYEETLIAKSRNRIGYAIGDLLTASLQSTLNLRRKQWKLPELTIPDDSFSRLAQISSLPREFDFPRQHLPDCFSYVGPLIDSQRPAVAFPWERLDGRPLVYASFGTLQNRRSEAFLAVAAACASLDVQLVLSTGGGGGLELTLPGSPVVVEYAPQLEILERASVCITHSGLNTVLESLYSGVPMIAIPITNDQPAVAARVRHSGTGVVIPFRGLTSEKLRFAVQKVLYDHRYRHRCLEFRESIRSGNGIVRTAELLEAVQRRQARSVPAKTRGASGI